MQAITSQPLVSVIVRTKDRAESLRHCIDSIAKQTYRPIEIVVINDGGKSVLTLIEQLPTNLTTKLIELEKNIGRTAAANMGLEHATGDFLCFLDDDDYWLPHHLQTLALPLSESAANNQESLLGVVYSSTKAVKVDNDGEEHLLSIFETPFDPLHLVRNNFIPIMSALFLRRWIDEGVRFDSQFDLFEDWDFWLQIQQKCQFKHIPEISAIYRLHEGASGVHDHTLANAAALSLYHKWLPTLSSTEIALLIQQANTDTEEQIHSIQEENQKQLNKIGEQHSHALTVIHQKDKNIAHLESLYKNAINTIETKDDNIDHLDNLYQHAISVIEAKDLDIERINRDIHTLELKNIDYQTIIAEQEIAIKESNSQIEDLRNQVENLDHSLISTKKELNHLKSTFTWRLYSKIKSLIN
ncbi:glycosyltransferase family 2 protein [Marinomonas algicola]|uniref:glycosyltransferase family 2 protein n=1 Tax=Marinomonas algicola TaxID=2773454 RepID=UPI00174BF57B|nr:glycosyltransferase [Marinomonas algicola]